MMCLLFMLLGSYELLCQCSHELGGLYTNYSHEQLWCFGVHVHYDVRAIFRRAGFIICMPTYSPFINSYIDFSYIEQLLLGLAEMFAEYTCPSYEFREKFLTVISLDY